MGRSKFDPDEYIEWLERVPQENRDQLAEILSQTTITTYDDVVSFSQKVMTHVLAGYIAPVAAEAAAINAGDTYVELIDALTQAQEDDVEASYTTIEESYAEAVNE